MKIKTVLLILLLLNNCLALSQINLDSLWGVWSNEKASDTARTLALGKYSVEGYLFSQPDSAFYFAQILYDFASLKGLKKDMAQAKMFQGVSYYIKSNYPKALSYYEQSLAISKKIGDRGGMAGTLNNIGVIYRKKGYNTKALDYYLECLKISEEITDKNGEATALNNIGIIYLKMEDFSKAMEFYQRAYDIQEELGDLSGIADALNNMGIVYKQLGEYNKAIDCFQRCLELRNKISYKISIASTLNNIGEVYMKQGRLPEALDYYQRGLKIKEELSDERGMVNSLNNIGMICYLEGNYTKAIEWFYKGLEAAEVSNSLEGIKKSCQCLYDAYKAIGNHAKALEYHERTTLLNDSLQLEETEKKLQLMEFAQLILADSLKREEERLILQIANEKELRKKKRIRNIYLLIAFLMLIGAVSIYRRVHFARKAKKEIEKEKERSDKLLHNILPSKIADELKMKGKAEAKSFEKVTILFSNFKGFSKISERLSAEELVSEINSCFEPFDQICQKYGIEKIKTIGDSYMAAGGIPVPTDDAVKKTVLAGLEMISCINKKKNEKKMECKLCFEMRVGIHTGPVVAGVVGVSKFHYDIWGDSVNTASRLEDAGEVGKVNISQTTYELIKNDPEFKFEQRGKIQTKGKGDIEMWFVEKVK